MSSHQPDHQNFEYQYQNTGFDAELGERRRGPSCCSCACCLGCFGFLLLTALAVCAAWYCFFSGGAELVVSPETTVIVEPLKPDGTVDFHEAIQEVLRRDTQPAENGFRDILRDYGRAIFAGDRKAAVLHAVLCEELDVNQDQEAQPAFVLTPFEPNNVPQWLGAVGDGLDAVHVAADRPHYFIPLVRESSSDFAALSLPFAVYAFHERLSEALLSRAEERFDSQEVEGAWQDVLASARLFRRATVNAAWLHALQSSGNEETYLIPAPWVVETLPRWTPEQLEQAVKNLESLPAWQDRQTTLTILQYQLLDLLSSMHNVEGLLHRLDHDLNTRDGREIIVALSTIAFDWNTVARELNSAVRAYGDLLEQAAGKNLEEQFELLRLGESAALPSDKQEWAQFLADSVSHDPSLIFTPGRSKLAGSVAGDLVTWAAGEMYRLQLLEESRTQALRWALALEKYRRENQAYPDSLDALGLPPMVPDMQFEYEKQDAGYRLHNKMFQLEGR